MTFTFSFEIKQWSGKIKICWSCSELQNVFMTFLQTVCTSWQMEFGGNKEASNQNLKCQSFKTIFNVSLIYLRETKRYLRIQTFTRICTTSCSILIQKYHISKQEWNFGTHVYYGNWPQRQKLLDHTSYSLIFKQCQNLFVI